MNFVVKESSGSLYEARGQTEELQFRSEDAINWPKPHRDESAPGVYYYRQSTKTGHTSIWFAIREYVGTYMYMRYKLRRGDSLVPIPGGVQYTSLLVGRRKQSITPVFVAGLEFETELGGFHGLVDAPRRVPDARNNAR